MTVNASSAHRLKMQYALYILRLKIALRALNTTGIPFWLSLSYNLIMEHPEKFSWIFAYISHHQPAGRRFYRIQLYTVITLQTQLNTAQLYMVTTRHRTTLHVYNSTQHNSTRHNSTRPQLYTATTRHATILHRPHGRKVEATIQ